MENPTTRTPPGAYFFSIICQTKSKDFTALEFASLQRELAKQAQARPGDKKKDGTPQHKQIVLEMVQQAWRRVEQLLLNTAGRTRFELNIIKEFVGIVAIVLQAIEKDPLQTMLLLCLFVVSLVIFQWVVVCVRSWAVSRVGPRDYNTIVVVMIVACTSGQAYHEATEAPWFFWMASNTDPGRFIAQWVTHSMSMLLMCYMFGVLAPMSEETEHRRRQY